jgi:hypothetical protein
MNRFQSLILIFLAAIRPAAGANWLSSFFHEDPDVVANTDVFDHNAPTPGPGKPVYYLAVSAGFRDLGWPMSGEKVPESTGVLRMVTKILEGQGYQLTPTGRTRHPWFPDLPTCFNRS